MFLIVEVKHEDTAENLKELIDDIGRRRAPGHSFEILVDPEPPDGKLGSHFFDGDGHDRIVGTVILGEEEI